MDKRQRSGSGCFLTHAALFDDSAKHVPAADDSNQATVVHHGGAGTTAAGLKSGVPSIVVTHGNDTPGWGQLVYDLGVGSKPIPRKKLSAENLAEAIQYTGSNEIQQAARILGEKIQTEHGAETAAQIIMTSIAAQSR